MPNSYLNEFSVQYAELMNKARDSFKGAVKQFLKDTPKAKYLAIYGYTPSFNDGEPCEFSADIVEELGEDAEHFLSDISEEISEDFVSWSDSFEDWHEFSNLYANFSISDDVTQNVLESLYGRWGWTVVFWLDESGALQSEQGEYDCGY